MTDLRKAAEDLLEVVEAAIEAGDWYVDGACDPDSAIVRLRQALAQSEQEFVGACVTCGAPKGEWLVDAVNMSQGCVDEMAKGEHEPFAWMVDNEGNKYKIPEANKGPLLKAMERKWVKKSRRRKWVELTDEDIQSCPSWCGDQHDFSYEIEAKLKEKNT